NVRSTEPATTDQRTPHVGSAAVVLRQRRDERTVFRGEHRQIRRTVGCLRRLVVTLDLMWRQTIESPPVREEPLTETHRARGRTAGGVKARFDDGLRPHGGGRGAQTALKTPHPP